MSIHHSPALIHLRKSGVYENINRQSFSFQQHKDLSCVFQVYSLIGLMFHLQQERPVLSAPACTLTRLRLCEGATGAADSVYMTADLSVPLAAKVVYLCKSCVLHLCGPHFSPPLFQFPATSSLPPSVWALFDVSLPRLRVTRQIFSCHLRTPEAICQFQLASCVHCALVTQSNVSNGRCWPRVHVWSRARACVLSLAA